jgi:SAM-dependent methyltransferase
MPTILDSGCGNGLSIDILARAGFDAWGHDLSALRKWQWRERERRDRLVVADALRLPFEDASFDFVLSSGVIEHIGVQETGGATYTVKPLPSRDAMRREYIRELVRVARGSLFIDCPNGAFPIDFWHGPRAGGMRWHSPREGFLATFRQIARLAHEVDPSLRVRALSPHRRLRFEQVGRHWYGRAFAIPAAMLLRAMNVMPWLARSAVNPYLVMELTADR